ncbi:hypothetical protein [Nocardia sp. NPDC004260]
MRHDLKTLRLWRSEVDDLALHQFVAALKTAEDQMVVAREVLDVWRDELLVAGRSRANRETMSRTIWPTPSDRYVPAALFWKPTADITCADDAAGARPTRHRTDHID